MKKLLTLALALAMALSAFGIGALAETDPAALVPEEFGKVIPIPKDSGNVLAYDYNYYFGSLPGGRVWKEYIPEGMEKYKYVIMLNVPEGWSTEEFLVKSGWIDVAETNKCSLFILEPVDGHWGTAAEEWAYLTAAYAKRSASVTPQSVYAVGYGEAGSLLQTFVMQHATSFAGAAFVDASDIAPETIQAVGCSIIGDTPNKEDYKVKNNQVPLPVWIIDSDLNAVNTAAVLDYWKAVNKTSAEGKDFEGGKLYEQAEEIKVADGSWEHSFTPFGMIASVAELQKTTDYEDKALTAAIYEKFLEPCYRYAVNIWSSILIPKPDYEAMGVEKKFFTDQDGYKREVLIYCPEAFRNGEALPVVFMNPGGGGTEDFLFNATGFYKIAEREGFIIAALCGVQGEEYTTGKSGSYYLMDDESKGDRDLNLVKDILAYAKENYAVDETRVYFAGINIFPYYAAQNLHDIFAAQATSMRVWAAGPNEGVKAADSVPVYTLLGEYDYDVTGLYDWKTVGTPQNNMIVNRLNLNGHFGEVTGDALPEPTVLTTEENARYAIFEWTDPENGEPVVRYAVTDNKAHAFLWTDSELEWEFLQHWTLDPETKEHVYHP